MKVVKRLKIRYLKPKNTRARAQNGVAVRKYLRCCALEVPIAVCLSCPQRQWIHTRGGGRRNMMTTNARPGSRGRNPAAADCSHLLTSPNQNLPLDAPRCQKKMLISWILRNNLRERKYTLLSKLFVDYLSNTYTLNNLSSLIQYCTNA